MTPARARFVLIPLAEAERSLVSRVPGPGPEQMLRVPAELVVASEGRLKR